MLLMDCHFRDDMAGPMLTRTLQGLDTITAGNTAFLCIGSDRHILDCLGPLTGTMLQERVPQLLIYGTLDKPLHAGNLLHELPAIKKRQPGAILALDASVGREEELGMIRLRDEPLMPGKALLKGLPPIGDFSLTGVVSRRSENRLKSTQNGSLGAVYQIARLISKALALWYEQSLPVPWTNPGNDGLP